MVAVPATIKPFPAPLPPTGHNAEPPKRQPLTASQISTVKSTIPLLAQHAVAITTTFYDAMLRAEPRMRDVFNSGNMATGRQPAALAAALCAYAAHIDDLAALAPAVELIAQRHASLGIRAADYAVVARYLLAAMRDVLGADVVTDEVADAWAAAYWQLADVFIAREAALYALQRDAGWPQQQTEGEQEVGGGGWRRFRIARKERESEAITSFYLEPEPAAVAGAVDAGEAVNGASSKPSPPLPPFLPGQYVSIRTPVPELGAGRVQARQYSLSDAPNGAYYRVSIKRDAGGVVSRAMHDLRGVGDVVEVSHPQGEFHFDAAADDDGAADAPVVLISAGVGMTSVTSILNALTKDSGTSLKRPVTYIHCAHSTSLRAFRSHIHALSKPSQSSSSSSSNANNLRVVLFNTLVDDGDVLGEDYHFAGRLDLGQLDAERDLHIGDARTQYFVCGPLGFMSDVEAWLRARGVEGARVHSEVFGPSTAGRS